jgi:hypothetical protein
MNIFGNSTEEVDNTVKNKILFRIIMGIALLILAIPVTASAQIVYDRNYDRYDRSDRRDVRDAINRLDNSAVQLEQDLNTGRQRRVLGGLLSFSTVDNNAVAEVRNFRSAVRDLRRSVRNDSLNSSRDEARVVLERGVQRSLLRLLKVPMSTRISLA